MSSFSTESCQDAEPFFYNSSFRSMLLCNVGVCLVGILLNVVFAFRYYNNTLLPPAIKIIVSYYVLNYIVNTILLVFIRGMHFIMYYKAKSPCDVLVDRTFCVYLNFTQTVLQCQPTFLHFAMSVDRLLAFNNKRFNKQYGWKLGAVQCLASLLLALGVTCFLFRKFVPKGKVAYCSSMTTSNASDALILTATLIAVEIITIISSFGSYLIRRNTDKRRTYVMSQRFQQSENIYVFCLMLPWMVVHFILFTTFYGNSLVVSNLFGTDLIKVLTLNGFTNLHPIYSVVLPVLLTIIIRRQKNTRQAAITQLVGHDASADNYFRAYGWM